VTRRTKLVLYLAGTALLLLSFFYVGTSIAENWPAVEQVQIHSILWILACVTFYAVSHFSTGLSWPLAVRQLGIKMPIRDGLRIGLTAQIGKYLPGNVAHYVGRGALASKFGVPLKSTGLSTAIEFGSVLTAVMFVGSIGLLIDPRPIAWLPDFSTSGAAIVIAIVAGLVATSVWLFRKGTRLALLAGPTLCLTVSLVLSGMSIYALTRALGYAELPVAVAIGTFAIAWGAGFVVPGAPAGLGVREATLLALLSPMIGPGPAVALAILHRLITAAVDAVAALVGYAWLASDSFAKK
jgi:uncharacterized membrane protein YbhN (UPF0104 family)